jgi:hypothetical protein
MECLLSFSPEYFVLRSHIKILKIETKKKTNFASYTVRVRDLVSYFEGGT